MPLLAHSASLGAQCGQLSSHAHTFAFQNSFTPHTLTLSLGHEHKHARSSQRRGKTHSAADIKPLPTGHGGSKLSGHGAYLPVHSKPCASLTLITALSPDDSPKNNSVHSPFPQFMRASWPLHASFPAQLNSTSSASCENTAMSVHEAVASQKMLKSASRGPSTVAFAHALSAQWIMHSLFSGHSRRAF